VFDIALVKVSGIGMLEKFADTLQIHHDGILANYDYPNINLPSGGHEQQNHKAGNLQLQRQRVPQTQNHGNSSLKVRFSRINPFSRQSPFLGYIPRGTVYPTHSKQR
jgi:hypothetical protein